MDNPKDIYGKDAFSLLHYDETYTWAAICYVEINPVRAGMIKQTEEYSWSSVAAHCEIKVTNVLKLKTSNAIPESDCSSWLAVQESEEALTILRRNVEKGLPCGSDEFIEKSDNKYSNYGMKISN